MTNEINSSIVYNAREDAEFISNVEGLKMIAEQQVTLGKCNQ